MNFHNYVYYDETSPTYLRWKHDKYVGKYSNVLKYAEGDVAGSIQKRRVTISIEMKFYAVHRVILALHGIPCEDSQVVDHLDGNPHNNQINNLRATSQSVNSRNKKKSSANTSGVTGVNLHRDAYWRVQWYEEGKLRCKYFSIEKLGFENAFNTACQYRKQMIDNLNQKDYNYSGRHGR